MQPANFRHEIQETVHGHVAVSRGVFRQIANKFFCGDGIFSYVESAYRHGSFRGRNETGDQPHGRRFARAVGAQETQHLAALD